MDVPAQKFQVGDLVIATEDYFVYLKKGAIGMITNAFCHEVCTKGGIIGRMPEDGGPEHTMEWGYVGLFDAEARPQGVRLDYLTPVMIVDDYIALEEVA